MNNKEKAKALVQKYFDEVSDHMSWEQAKECAIIAVDFAWVLLKPHDDLPEINYSKIALLKEEIEAL